jgi:hypothetical protein
MSPGRQPPSACNKAIRRWRVRPTRDLLVVSIAHQRLQWFRRVTRSEALRTPPARYRLYRTVRASTSKFGIGQVKDSHRTPLGLHRICEKIGAGWPIGTVFRARQPVGFTWAGHPQATIAHRILWLEGMELGFNCGDDVDSRGRFIYIHGLGDEPTLGRPASHGCVHLAASDLIPLFDRVSVGTQVWIQRE